MSSAVRGPGVGGEGRESALDAERPAPPAPGGGVPNMLRTLWVNSRLRSRYVYNTLGANLCPVLTPFAGFDASLREGNAPRDPRSVRPVRESIDDR